MMDIIVIMGVSGCGKSSVGEELAYRIHWSFKDGDDFHSMQNKEKMRRGISLTDDDRQPWLESINRYCKEHPKTIIACSALKRIYRDILRNGVFCQFVHLAVNRKELERRIHLRANHFMPITLLESQLSTLEDAQFDEYDMLSIECSSIPICNIVHQICDKLSL